jgi:RNA polymerase sigma factor for flagellar operon FliA
MDSTLNVWHAAQSGTDPEARNALMTKHLRLVKHVARQVCQSTPVDVEFDELVSAGTIGLMNAIDKFDPSRGLAFSTFAAPRIRGSVLDDLRRRDHVPRSLRKKQRELSRARERLGAELGRAPSDEEMARELDLGIDELWRWQHQVERTGRVSVDGQLGSDARPGVVSPEVLADTDALDVESSINLGEEANILRDEIMNLKDQERVVLSLYYFEDLKLREIATVLGVTESRVSQIRSKAISNLREKLAHLRAA